MLSDYCKLDNPHGEHLIEFVPGQPNLMSYCDGAEVAGVTRFKLDSPAGKQSEDLITFTCGGCEAPVPNSELWDHARIYHLSGEIEVDTRMGDWPDAKNTRSTSR